MATRCTWCKIGRMIVALALGVILPCVALAATINVVPGDGDQVNIAHGRSNP